MPWFKRADDSSREESELARRNSQLSLQQLQAGGLPLAAQQRLERQRQPGGVWTGDLTVDELAALHSVGLDPIAQVVGSSIYHVGWYGANSQMGGWQSGEMAPMTQALTDARQLAVSRLNKEAIALQAHGVVGLRLVLNSYEWGQGLIEFSAAGTAVRFRNADSVDRPFLAEMDSQEVAKCLGSGWVPCGFAMGVCVYYLATNWSSQMQQSLWNLQNQEMPQFTDAIYRVRHAGMSRLVAEARAQGGNMVAGTKFELRVRPIKISRGGSETEDHILEFTAQGTTLARFRSDAPDAKPQMYKPLTDIG